MRHLPAQLIKEFSGEMSKATTDTIIEAKGKHRYNTNKGFLERSTKSFLKKTGKTIHAEVYLEDTIANYGKYVHNGFKSWRPDKFLEKAYDKFFGKLSEKVQRRINELLR